MAENIKIIYQVESGDVSDLIAKISKLTAEEKDLLKSIIEVEKQSKKTTETQKQGFDDLGKIAKRVGAVIVTAFAFDKIKDFGSEVLKTTSTFQKYEAVLRNTLGSQKKATEAMALIQKFAAETPFSVEQLTDSFVKLANRGFVPTEKEMRSLGDLASSLGKPFDQLTEAILDAMTGEMERLKEFGVKSEKEGDRIKFTFKGVKTEVANTEDAIKKYVLSLGELKGVSGSMGAISKTLEGQISNLGDTFDQLKLAIGQRLAGAFSFAISGISSMITAFTNFINPAKTFTQTIEQEREGLNLLVSKITDTNVKTDERKQLIQQLQAEYPNFLKNLDAEKVSNEQLADRLRDANKEYKNKLLLATSENALQTQAKKLEVARKNFTDADLAIDDLNNKIRMKILELPQNQQRQLQAIMQGVENDSEKLAQQLIKVKDDPMFKDLVTQFDTRVSTIGGGDRLQANEKLTEFGELLSNLSVNVSKYKNANNTIINESDKFAKSQDKFNKKFGENNVFTDRTDPKKVVAKTQEISKAQYDALEKASKAKADLDLRSLEAQRKMEMQRLEQQKTINDQLLKNDKLTVTEKTSLIKGGFELETQILELKKNQELNSFEVIETKLKTHSTFAVGQKKLTEKEKQEITQRANDAEVIAERNKNQELANLYLQYVEELRKERESNLQKQQDELDNNVQIELQSDLQTLEISEQAYQQYQNNKNQVLREAEQTRRDLKLGFLENELNLLGDDEIEKRKQIESEITQIKKDNLKAQTENEEKRVEESIENEKKRQQAIQEIAQQAQELLMEISEIYFQSRADNLQGEMDNLTAQKDYELKMAGDNAEKKAFIEKEYNSKLKALKREQAQQEKEKAIFNVIINTIQGVATAVARAELFPFNFVLAGIIGAIGAAQLVAIQSKPVPKFFEGTDYLQRGNNPMGRDTIPIFANEGERIVPNAINEKLKGIPNGQLPELVRLGLEMKQMAGISTQMVKPKETPHNINVIVKNDVDLSKIPQSKFVFDKEGFAEYVEKTNQQTKNLNADYQL